jgi:hypothetical protein
MVEIFVSEEITWGAMFIVSEEITWGAMFIDCKQLDVKFRFQYFSQ